MLSLLHFGLREGGVLVLGNSETIGERGDLFEPVDKKHRIYRRVGPTRHGMSDFPRFQFATRHAVETAEGADARTLSRGSLSQVTNKLLLDTYTPPAIVLDRHGRIVYFHGETELFLDQPRGEPTREVLVPARDFVRGAVRVALHQAIETGAMTTVKDGLMQVDGASHRVEIGVAPLDSRGVAGYYLMTFRHFPVSLMQVASEEGMANLDVADELRSIREELQSTIEELQTSNEELKASNQEVTSVNEELQSTNEQLETSKEELQSLNEELSTVNAQLQAKMEEIERTGNDLSSLLSSTDIADIFLDTQFRIRRFTPAVRKLVDLIPSDVGRPMTDLANKFTDPDLAEDARNVLESLVPREKEIVATTGRWFMRRVLPYHTNDNRIEGVVVTFVDVTERRLAESALRASEQRLRAVAENLPGGAVFLVGSDLRYQLAAGQALKAAGLTSGALDGKSLHEALPPELANDDVPYYEKALAGEAFDREHSAHGRHYISHGVPLRDGTGKVTSVLVVSYDITDRKDAEKAVRDREAELRVLTDVVPDLLWQSDGDGLIDWCNQRWFDFTGQTLQQAGGLGWLDAIHADDREQTETKYLAPMAKAIDFRYEHRMRRHDGEYRWFFVQARPLLGSAGRVARWFGAATDIHEQRVAFDLARGAESKFRAVADVVPEMLWQVDVDGKPLWHNQRWTDYTGQTLEETSESTRLDAVHPDDRADTAATFEQAIRSGQTWRHEYRVRRAADNTYRWFLVQGVPQRDTSGQILNWFGSLTDIHEHRTILDELNASESRLKSVLDSARDFAILLIDVDGRITQWSAGATALMQWIEPEVIGQRCDLIFTDEDRAANAPNHERQMALRDGRAPDERWHRRKDGSRFWGSGVMSDARDEAGRHRGFVKVLRDTTERRQAESERTQLLRAEQHARAVAESANAAKDYFLANVSHELRTPLSAILLWSKVLGDVGVNAETLAEGLAAIDSSARSQQKLIEDLLDSACIETGKLTLELKPVDLTRTVGNAINTVRPAADAKGVEIDTDLGTDIGQVLADADRLQQVVWNLVSNALKFTPAGGRIDVRLLRRGSEVEIRVADTGIGIEAADLPELFARFRQADPTSTRRTGGVGLGLAISRQLIELHGGTIRAESDGPDRGSAFTILLPLPKRTAKTLKAKAAKEADLAGARIVLVEDDERTPNVVAMLLRQAGATVEAFAHADPAKAAFLASPPDVLLSDIGLPDQDGYTLIRELRATESADRRVPALAFTAFDRLEDRTLAMESGFDEYLTKPVDPVRLVQVLRTLLGR